MTRRLFDRREIARRNARGQGLTNLAVKEVARRYSPAQVMAVERDIVSGVPAQALRSAWRRSSPIRNLPA